MLNLLEVLEACRNNKLTQIPDSWMILNPLEASCSGTCAACGPKAQDTLERTAGMGPGGGGPGGPGDLEIRVQCEHLCQVGP